MLTLGMILGSLFTFSPGTLFIVGLVGLACLLFQGFVSFEERRFVLFLFLAGFFIRAILSIGMDASMWLASGGKAFRVESTELPGIFNGVDESRGFFRMGDSDYYTPRSLALARYAKGHRDGRSEWGRFSHYGRGGYLYVMAFFNFLFGFSPVAVKLINCFWGAFLGPFVYLLGKAAFHQTIGRWAGVTCTFFPSLILWSASNLKDTSLIVLGVALLLIFFRMMEGVRSKLSFWVCGALFCTALWGHAAMRDPLFTLSLVVCLAVSLWCVLPIQRSAKIFGLAGVLVMAIFFHSAFEKALIQGLIHHRGHAWTFPGMPYFYLPEKFYTDGLWSSEVGWNLPFLFGLVRGILHYLLEPFPWRPGSLMRVFSIPQMAFWMVALIFAAYGMWAVFRWRRWTALSIVLVAAAWTFLGAIISGNVGTVFRMRDMVTPFYLIPASAGLWFFMQRSPTRSSHS
jgi:hypothetical protein